MKRQQREPVQPQFTGSGPTEWCTSSIVRYPAPKSYIARYRVMVHFFSSLEVHSGTLYIFPSNVDHDYHDFHVHLFMYPCTIQVTPHPILSQASFTAPRHQPWWHSYHCRQWRRFLHLFLSIYDQLTMRLLGIDINRLPPIKSPAWIETVCEWETTCWIIVPATPYIYSHLPQSKVLTQSTSHQITSSLNKNFISFS